LYNRDFSNCPPLAWLASGENKFIVVGPRDILSAIEDLGYSASIYKRDLQSNEDYLGHKEEIAKWRLSFIVSYDNFCFLP